MVKKLVALDLLNTILSKVYTKITNETNKKIELATKEYADTFIPLTQKAAVNGVATLDANGHVPVEQMPTQALIFKGYWNASTGSLPAAGTVSGDFYIVSVEGTISGVIYRPGDWIIWDGSTWTLSRNTNAVASVNGQTGAVTLDGSNIQATYEGTTDTINTLLTQVGKVKTVNNQSPDANGNIQIDLSTNVALNNQLASYDWASVAGFSGRNLVDVLGVSSVSAAAQALKAKSDAKDYSGLRLGDYLEFAVTYGEYGSITAKYEIAAMGQYHWFYNGSSEKWDLGSITFVASKILFSRQIGATTNQRMYFTSPMNTLLTGTIAPAIEGVLGVTLKRPIFAQFYNAKTYASPSWTRDEGNVANCSPKVYLPSSREFAGEAGYVDNSHQFPLFANVPGKIPAKNQSDSFAWEWTRSPSVDPGHFYGVNNVGCSVSSGASYSAGGVRPAFNL